MTVSVLSTAVAAVAMLLVVARARRRLPTSVPPPVRLPRRRRRRAPDPDSIVLAVDLGGRFAGAAHERLRPLLREVAMARLARRGVDLDRDAAAEAILGSELYELVRADRPRPPERMARGISQDVLGDHLRRLEEL